MKSLRSYIAVALIAAAMVIADPQTGSAADQKIKAKVPGIT